MLLGCHKSSVNIGVVAVDYAHYLAVHALADAYVFKIEHQIQGSHSTDDQGNGNAQSSRGGQELYPEQMQDDVDEIEPIDYGTDEIVADDFEQEEGE